MVVGVSSFCSFFMGVLALAFFLSFVSSEKEFLWRTSARHTSVVKAEFCARLSANNRSVFGVWEEFSKRLKVKLTLLIHLLFVLSREMYFL